MARKIASICAVVAFSVSERQRSCGDRAHSMEWEPAVLAVVRFRSRHRTCGMLRLAACTASSATRIRRTRSLRAATKTPAQLCVLGVLLPGCRSLPAPGARNSWRICHSTSSCSMAKVQEYDVGARAEQCPEQLHEVVGHQRVPGQPRGAHHRLRGAGRIQLQRDVAQLARQASHGRTERRTPLQAVACQVHAQAMNR